MRACGATPDYAGALMRGVGDQVRKLDAEHSGDHRDGACRWPQDGAHTKVSLTDDQFSTLVNALLVAAKQYERDRSLFREQARTSTGHTSVASVRLADQFDRQVVLVNQLSDLLDTAESVEVIHGEYE